MTCKDCLHAPAMWRERRASGYRWDSAYTAVAGVIHITAIGADSMVTMTMYYAPTAEHI